MINFTLTESRTYRIVIRKAKKEIFHNIMKRVFTYIASPETSGITIEQFLRRKGYSRHILTHLKQTENGICKNGIWAYANQRMKPGDCLTVTLLEEKSSENIVPVPMPLSIVYEDADLMILNKPADTPIHPSVNNYENTLANGISWYFYAQGIPFVYRCINRLDRDTTGLLILAKHMYSAALLSKMAANREIHREYLAIASGLLPVSGVIDAPISRKNGSAIERCVDFSCGEQAITHFQREAFKDDCSLVRLKLETGRTHQIRVHMKYLGHPLIGDFLYCADYPEQQKRMQRQALHSHHLQFLHPITGKEMSFTAPLPPDMEWIL